MISEFIELHKSFTCLRDMTCKRYGDRDARNQLHEIFKEKLMITLLEQFPVLVV